MMIDLMVIVSTGRKKGAGVSKERYSDNRDRVYDIYEVEDKLRSRSWNMHHQQFKSQGGTDDVENLIPMPVRLHNRLHAGDSAKELHAFCESEYGGDPYQGNGNWEQEEWANKPSKKERPRNNKPKKQKQKRGGRRKRGKRRR